MIRPLAIQPDKAAVLFIDLQEEHRRDERYLVEGFDGVLAKARKLRREAFRSEVPAFHCAHIVDAEAGGTRPFHPLDCHGASAYSDKDSPWTGICPEVAPEPGEPVLIMTEASAFGDGSLEHMLRQRGVEWLFVCGVWTEACVDATVKDAVRLGFRVALVKDACGSGTQAMHQAGVLNIANRLYGGAVMDTNDACTLMMGMAIKAWQTEEPVPLRFTFENASELYGAL